MNEVFNSRLKKLLENSNFFVLYLVNVLWNFRSRKFIALVIAGIFLYLGKLSSGEFIIALGIYAGSNILDKGTNVLGSIGNKNGDRV